MKISARTETVSMPRTEYVLWERIINGTPYQFSADRCSIRVTNLKTMKQVHTFKR